MLTQKVRKKSFKIMQVENFERFQNTKDNDLHDMLVRRVLKMVEIVA